MKRFSLFAFVTFLTFLIGVSITRFGPAPLRRHLEPSPWQVLLSFENQDLENLDDQSDRAVKQAIEAITGRPKQDSFSSFSPRLFRTISNTKGEKRYILVEEAPLVMIPSEARLRVHVFDTAGNLLSGEAFGAGWRTILTGMKIRKMPMIGQDGLVVDGEYCFGGHASHQYYVVVENQLSLIYLEKDGQLDRNCYQYSHTTIGPRIPQRSVDDWEKALQSADTAEVMSALMWLAGQHWSGQDHPFDEDRPEAEKISVLRSRSSVGKVLMELEQSSNLWIQMLAKASLEQ